MVIINLKEKGVYQCLCCRLKWTVAGAVCENEHTPGSVLLCFYLSMEDRSEIRDIPDKLGYNEHHTARACQTHVIMKTLPAVKDFTSISYPHPEKTNMCFACFRGDRLELRALKTTDWSTSRVQNKKPRKQETLPSLICYDQYRINRKNMFPWPPWPLIRVSTPLRATLPLSEDC